MLVDPTGKGHVVRRGDFVGRADVVQLAGATGATYELNWRLDRIRDGDVVLVREDPNNPDVPAATKVIPLEARRRRRHGRVTCARLPRECRALRIAANLFVSIANR